ncbi:alpha/beta fold hydrolase [Nocardioides sp. SR21]|uniref:alpha/beta fold hydrolase n=1 Tax=Nocardioides sp. SR21 TaxID=2919501 RepID=UPI001FAA62B2|nr:alpha/beta hydrolase [Nocardioides sp. SR21]
MSKLILVIALLGALLTSPAHAGAPEPRPTIVFVHGAWADSSGWSAELQSMREEGYDAIAVANPLRGLTSDAAYVRSVLETIEGPIVLVAHSYGGAVISAAATGLPNVEALVYVAAFVPDEGEPVGLLTQLNPGSLVTEDALQARPYPLPDGGTGVDLYLRPGIFREAFAQDLPKRTTRLMWATQRPLAAAAFGEPAGAVAWPTIPSWYLIATQDHTIPPKTQAYMAERAGSTVVRVKASHVAMQSRPGATTKLILAAVHAVD